MVSLIIIGALCRSLKKKFGQRSSSLNFLCSITVNGFVNIFKSLEDYQVTKRAACGIAEGKINARKINLFCQDGRTALSVAVTCESESAAKLVTLLIGIIVPLLLSQHASS
jgi:hypothetical protein